MKIFDISRPIQENMPVWPGHPPVEINGLSRMAEGGRNNLSYLGMTVHTGTHVDAPFHFLNNGETTENLSLHTLIGPAQVVEVPPSVNLISSEMLRLCELDETCERVLLKTRGSNLTEDAIEPVSKELIALSAEGASYLVALGVRLVGIDSLSIASADEGVVTHQILLQSGMVIIEGLDLGNVSKGRYELFCLPLKIVGLDGAPARAILIQHDE